MEPNEHLSESALEALSQRRDDLASERERAHLAGCAECAAAVEREREFALGLAPALISAAPVAPDFSAMISAAMATAVAPGPVPEPAVPVPSRRSLVAGTSVALVLLAVGLAFVVRDTAAISRALDAMRDALTVAMSVFRLVLFTAPGGSAAVALVGLFLFALIALGLHRLAEGVSRPHSSEVFSS